MKLSIISDEISLDFQSAVEIGCGWGLRNYELRGAWLRRAPYIPEQGAHIIKKVIDNYKITITALSPGVFKIPLNSDKMEAHRKKLLPDTFRLAREFNVDKVIIFGIKRSPQNKEEDYQHVIDIMGETACSAEKEGFTLMLENEAGWWADTGENTARIVKDVGSKMLRINWDPSNAFSAGEEPYPVGYEFVKEYVANVHVKRAFEDTEGKTRYLTTGKGDINWEGQIQTLAKNNYKGYLAIETHLEPKIKESEKCLEILKKIGQGCV
ncbi:MAG: TIM barrel protein [Clostridia bacterium]|jgi:sugar phosphate isomerase/epimerase|nr:TIM barrel protein [Clostridia bacterium]